MSLDLTSMAQVLISGGILPLIILCLVAVEAIALYVLRRGFGIGPGLAAMAGSLLSGACLVLALYVALSGGSAELVLMCLAGSFAVHLADLAWRMREATGRLSVTDKGMGAKRSA
jgi:hypothetical protein